jgi:hypothetical protein
MKLLIVLLLLCVSLCAAQDNQRDYICICNRGSSTVSIVDPGNDEIVLNLVVPVPEGGLPTVPMYCDYYELEAVDDNGNAQLKKHLTVGERANQHLVVFDVANSFEIVARVPLGPGVFHHWVSNVANQIWVACDGGTDNPKTDVNVWVIALDTLTVIHVIPFPEDLRTLAEGSGGVMHDVLVEPNGKFAIVTTWNMPSFNDFALKFSTETFAETGRIEVGRQAHCTLTENNGRLLIASQRTLLDSILVIDVESMTKISAVAGIAGAHMLWGPSHDGKTYYATNLPGAGLDALYAFDSQTANVDFSATVDAPYTVPHNVAFNGPRTKLYLTHSGPNVHTTVWDVSRPNNPRPQLIDEIAGGSNPYGLAQFYTDIDIGSGGGGGGGGAASSIQALSLLLLTVIACIVYII